MAESNVSPIGKSKSATKKATSKKSRTSKQEAVGDAAYEFVFAVVGHVGSGTSEVAQQLHAALDDATVAGEQIDSEIIKATGLIDEWASENGHSNDGLKGTDRVSWFQDMGDQMRAKDGDHSIIARQFALKIRELRASKTGQDLSPDGPIMPDGKPRAYILDSIRHPDEVELLRHIYQDAFVLIGVVCQEPTRLDRLCKKHPSSGMQDCKELMKRDAKAAERYGQRTADAFHMADFFVDNSISRMVESGGQTAPNANWDILEKLGRLVTILSHNEVVRPTIDETGMHHAYSAQLRSACLSRQVGAALMDSDGNLLATGTNEVPRAGGGVYGESYKADLDESIADHRCAFRESKFCSNTKKQNEIVEETVDSISQVVKLNKSQREELAKVVKGGRIGALLEFSRAVHAEMDALLSAARSSSSIVGSRLFVSTFPCHFCARHIVTAGVDEVQYIEPYPKSAALQLHNDAIGTEWIDWKPPSSGGEKVLFRPFSGIAPRMYRRAFFMDRDLKNSDSGEMEIGTPDWAGPWHLGKSSYVTLEAKLIESS